ncbi:MAG: rhomboid family intramembrane serine protease [Candidatus Omnitrophica bacterium]|nr:rhomboid family intramembrane serine protease [Candidatus Omnitrophota bacterium]
MIPIRDTILATRTAWVVRLLCAANAGLFVIELLQGPRLDAFLYRFGVVPAYWTLTDPSDLLHAPWLIATLFTSQFLHGGLLHLGSNMLYLWIFGDNVEDRVGHGRFLLLYLGSGLIAGLTQLLLQPHASMPMIGASGAIAGVLGAYFLCFPFARVKTLIPWFLMMEIVEVPAFIFLGVWFFLQWLQGMTVIGQVAEMGGVAWWAHVGGFLTGLLLVVVLAPRRRYF